MNRHQAVSTDAERVLGAAGSARFRVDVTGGPIIITVDGVFKLTSGTVVTPHLAAEQLPRNSPVVIDVARGGASPRRITGRFELWHFRYLDGTGGFEGVISLDSDLSDAVAVGDVLTIQIASDGAQ
jgi:hypothetical protein